MAVSDYDLIQAWKQVLTLSKLERGQFVTVLTGAVSFMTARALSTSRSTSHPPSGRESTPSARREIPSARRRAREYARLKPATSTTR